MKTAKYVALLTVLILLPALIACVASRQENQEGNGTLDQQLTEQPVPSQPESGQPDTSQSNTSNQPGALHGPPPVPGTDAQGNYIGMDDFNDNTGTGETEPGNQGTDESGSGEETQGHLGVLDVTLPDGTTLHCDYEGDMERTVAYLATLTYISPADYWPDDLPIMAGLEICPGGTFARGAKYLFADAGCNIPAEHVRAYYTNLPGWSYTQDVVLQYVPAGTIAFKIVQGNISATVRLEPAPPSGCENLGDQTLGLAVDTQVGTT
jgi:hypothetical protein